MEDHNGLAWLARKIAWGLKPGQFDEWVQAGSAAVINELVNPDAAGVEPRPDPFAVVDRTESRQYLVVALGTVSWIEHAVDSPRPLETFMEFFWSDYFAVSARVVRPRHLIFEHMNLLGRHSLGNFAEMLRDVTIDAAMLDFLDGSRSTGTNPNENYGRELLELYTVGVGNFDEDDVKAATRALTGWRILRQVDNRVRLRDRRHDNTPQTLLGVAGVHDVDTALDATLAHPATAIRIVDKLASAILGPAYDQDLTNDLAPAFGQDWELRPVLQRLLELGVDGHATTAVVEPLPWYVAARKLPTPQALRPQLREFFAQSGQLPMQPPNVGGFPPPDSYLSTSATIARFNMASHLATRAMDGQAAAELRALSEDIDELADRLTLPGSFRPATRKALDGLNPGVDRLAAALAAPDLAVV